MQLADLISPSIDHTIRTVRNSRSWKVVRAVRAGVNTMPRLEAFLKVDERTIRTLIGKAGPIIWSGFNREGLPGGGRKFYFINPDYQAEFERRAAPKPQKPKRLIYEPDAMYAEPSEYELLKFPRLMQLNMLQHGRVFPVIQYMCEKRRTRIIELGRKLFPGPDAFSDAYKILKLLLADGFLIQRRPHFLIHPECLHCARLIESEVQH